ncbi:bifunctional adenosylcobinamide kinase/adenosylcobinamide-phosphate guanylyltransferase [Methylobacterium oxalidis]|uniref:Bifunctional adenosylcobalamin biosynthesis protein n=1 Tax=Methylobacterium oxalidis TaxID=944322 RepID=A0A512J2D7_9HYPH|nr:bifunctional adenosylcobinamide kinase/adenosylcobinamide-phosphate guanylyltransferase [Methylobacterium oxalidis]GEP04120.1 adenosylcobinamide kinase/adenosylcobinamide phosphate guanyltransferase [Methylobacterium oxalidis]GJE35245.1 Bifunctional adenosylcobalamin biosynthesis protein CobP [Methylobacterium oxalidis]GLS65051.1 adenosylcobinamide kinase/adenosylcobinamide phosphate guanyltransferase [Methylobacterium oxalidis]
MLQAAPRMTLVLGGARSGKSTHAEALIESCPPPWTYLATARAWDDEMRARIALHRERRSEGWMTRDVPRDLADAIREARGPVLVDCLTLWLTNLMLDEADLAEACEDLAAACAEAAGPLVLVSNEVGLGIVPDNAMARAFRDAAGRLHQRLAREADRVVFVVAGLPMVVKPATGQGGEIG